MSQYSPERYVKWKVRKAVLERDKTCAYCNLLVAGVRDDSEGGPNDHWRAYDKYGRSFHFDHKIPFSRGGNSDEANIVLACADCNLRKSNRCETDGKQLAFEMKVDKGKLVLMDTPRLL